MKKFNRIMAVIVLMACGFSTNAIYGSKEEVQAVFKFLKAGNYTAVLNSSLTDHEIVNARNAKGNSLIAEAVINVKKGKERELAEFIEQYIGMNLPFQKDREKLLNAQNKKGQTALMFAAQKGLIEVAKQLYDLGASSLLKDRRGDPAMNFYDDSPDATTDGRAMFGTWWFDDQEKKRR